MNGKCSNNSKKMKAYVKGEENRFTAEGIRHGARRGRGDVLSQRHE